MLPLVNNEFNSSTIYNPRSDAGFFDLYYPSPSPPIVKDWNQQSDYGMHLHPWQQYYFDYGVTGIPKTNSKLPFPDEDKFYLSKGFGEDACFIRKDSLGVADGVGGWRKVKGANSAFFSRNLMHFACQELSKLESLDYNSSQSPAEGGVYLSPCEQRLFYHQVDPIKILENSYRLAIESASSYKIKGSSTACIVILRNNELRIANLGDCGVVVLRDGVVIFQTLEQQHSFNFPYQLGTNSKDRPKDAQYYSYSVEKGDVIVMGSDGLFDNLFLSDIEEEVTKWKPDFDWVYDTNLSHALAARACKVSQQTTTNQSTPFEERAKKEGIKFQGGKRDDITVLVAVVAPQAQD
ncbi:protein serine/threonine phosphatase 2C [Neoconidiobolus thromboides FSU 785]|nr:protein serine/threonine phosphatase 2C [Neoconidiobolus thromboides FSU 785]